MAPRTYTSATKTNASGTTTARSRTLQAKCPENQSFVDQLAEKREQIATGNNFTFTLKKAVDSIIACKDAITTYEQAVALKGIGPSIGKMLFPLPKECKPKQPKVAAVATKKGGGRNKKKAPLEDSSNAASSSQESDAGSPLAAASTTAAASSVAPSAPSEAAANLKRRPDKHEIASMALKSQQQALKNQPVTKKEKAYLQAVQESESYKGRNLLWQLVLLIDKREKQCEHYSSKVEQCGVPTEIRTLPIGDMAWIAQGRTRRSNKNNSNNGNGNATSSIGNNGEVVTELMLGTIVERKEVADLVSSLFGTRYNEQQLRLKASGLPQVIFLIEGDTKSDQRRFTADAIKSTLWAIRIEKQNQVVQTEHMEETVNTLRLMHRRILKRTFPTAFYAEALPAFSEPGAAAGRPRQQQQQRDSFGEQHPHRRRRRRLESLHGLTFDQEPVPMAGMPRFITYKELCAKVERDREMGTRTIGSIHQAMLKQVETIGNKKIVAISREFPTPHSLLQAYDRMPSGSHSIAARKAFMANLRLDEEEAEHPDVAAAGTKAKVLGDKSAGELAIAYSVDESFERRNSVDGSNIAGEQHANLHVKPAARPRTAAATTTSAAAAKVATGATKASANPVAVAAASQAGSTISSTVTSAAASLESPDSGVDQEAADLERAMVASLLETTKRKHAPLPPPSATGGASKLNHKKIKSSQQPDDWKPLPREELVELLSSSSEDEATDTKVPASKAVVAAAAATKRRPMSVEFSDDSFFSPSPPPTKKRPSTGSSSSNSISNSRNKTGNSGPGPVLARNKATPPPTVPTNQSLQQSRTLAARLLESSSSSSSSEDDDDDGGGDKKCAALERIGGPTAYKKSSGAAKMNKPQQEIIEIDDD